MIRVEGKFIYLCTPSTGSRSAARVLIEQCGGVQLSQSHHATKDELDAVRYIYTEPYISVIRDPYDFILSRYWYATRGRAKRNWPFSDFFTRFTDTMHGNQFGARIAAYRDYVDQYYLFEDGLEAFFSAVGFPDVNIPNIGFNRVLPDHPRFRKERMPKTDMRRITSFFKEDIDLYERVAAQG